MFYVSYQRCLRHVRNEMKQMIPLKWQQTSSRQRTETAGGARTHRPSSPLWLVAGPAHGSPAYGPPCVPTAAVGATTEALTSYWSFNDEAQRRPAIEPLVINSQILPCPQKVKEKKQSTSRRNTQKKREKKDKKKTLCKNETAAWPTKSQKTKKQNKKASASWWILWLKRGSGKKIKRNECKEGDRQENGEK